MEGSKRQQKEAKGGKRRQNLRLRRRQKEAKGGKGMQRDAKGCKLSAPNLSKQLGIVAFAADRNFTLASPPTARALLPAKRKLIPPT